LSTGAQRVDRGGAHSELLRLSCNRKQNVLDPPLDPEIRVSAVRYGRSVDRGARPSRVKLKPWASGAPWRFGNPGLQNCQGEGRRFEPGVPLQLRPRLSSEIRREPRLFLLVSGPQLDLARSVRCPGEGLGRRASPRCDSQLELWRPEPLPSEGDGRRFTGGPEASSALPTRAKTSPRLFLRGRLAVTTAGSLSSRAHARRLASLARPSRRRREDLLDEDAPLLLLARGRGRRFGLPRSEARPAVP